MITITLFTHVIPFTCTQQKPPFWAPINKFVKLAARLFSWAIVCDFQKLSLWVNQSPGFPKITNDKDCRKNATLVQNRQSEPWSIKCLYLTASLISQAIVCDFQKIIAWVNWFIDFLKFTNGSQTQKKTIRMLLLLFGHHIYSLFVRSRITSRSLHRPPFPHTKKYTLRSSTFAYVFVICGKIPW